MKKLLLLLAMAIMVIGLVAGCGKSADNGGDKKSGTIGFSVSTLNNPFFVTMKEGVEAQAKALGLKVKIVDAQNDPAKQANDISDLLESGVSVLIINPVDSAAISTSVEAANAKNIPVITVDRSADKGKVVAHIASDNVKGGEMAAQLIADKVGKAVKDGTLAATIAQQPDQMGKIAIDTAQKVIKGEAVEAKIPVDLKVVTK